jgi:hypothetical protein
MSVIAGRRSTPRFSSTYPAPSWGAGLIEEMRVKSAPPLKRIVVAIDPAVTSGEHADETGIIVAATDGDGALLRARRPKTYKETHRIEHTRIDFQEAQTELEAMARKVLGDDEEQQPKALPPC